jgi:hypothetical protein
MIAIASIACAFFLGALCAFASRHIINGLSDRRARRRYIQYVQPTSIGDRLAPLSPSETEGVGTSILQTMYEQEDGCQRYSIKRSPHMGEKQPRCYEMTGRVIGLLDCLSSCGWGCSQGDHIFERLVARSVNQARAALRLSLMGFYDESLALTRGVGEIANLLSLFEAESGSFAQWKSLDERARRQQFSPVNVRTRLDAIGTPMRVTTQLYAELSSKTVHVNPSTSPQTYDIVGMPKGGAYYQDAGLLMCQNELAKAMTFVTYSAAKLSHLDKTLKKRLLEAGLELISATGKLGIENLDEMWNELRKASATSRGSS